jgi:hypothetical protein
MHSIGKTSLDDDRHSSPGGLRGSEMCVVPVAFRAIGITKRLPYEYDLSIGTHTLSALAGSGLSNHQIQQ